jgi:hypothetical protein
MTKDIFEERERAEEAVYFRGQDEKLIEKLRENARLEEIVKALAGSLQASNPELLRRVMALGITLETGSAFLLAPLVQVAWASGKVTERERATVLRLAGDRGVEEGSPAQALLLEWLQKRPSDTLFETAIEVLKSGLAVVPPDLREDRIKRIVQACHEVAEASGGLARLLGLVSGVSHKEETLLDAIDTTLRSARQDENGRRPEPGTH